MLNFELIRVAVALVATGIAAWQDGRTSFIDDKILWAMIAIGALLNLATLDLDFILFSIGGAAIIGAIGYYGYKTGQLGAGDVMLFAGLQLLLPFPAIETATMLGLLPQAGTYMQTAYLGIAQAFPFFVSFFIATSLLMLVGSSLLYAHRLWKNGQLVVRGKQLYLATGLGIAAIAFLYWFSTAYSLHLIQLALFVAVLASSLFTIAFKEKITESLVQQLTISQIEDEDILAIEQLDPVLVKKYSIEKVLTKENVEKLKKIEKSEGRHTFPVYKNLPRMGPYAFIGLVASIALISPIAFILFI